MIEKDQLNQLAERKEKFSQAVGQLGVARETIGTPQYTQRPNFNPENYEGIDNLLAKVRLAEIQRKIDIKIPQVEEKIRQLDERMRDISRIRELAERVPLMEELVRQGYLEEEDLVRARTFIQGLPPKGEAEPTVGKATAESKEDRILLPDGQDVTDKFTVGEGLVIKGLLCGSEQKPISSSELARFVYDDESPIDVLKVRLSVRLTPVRRKLDELGYRIVNLVPREQGRLGKEALYYLANKVEPTEGEKK